MGLVVVSEGAEFKAVSGKGADRWMASNVAWLGLPPWLSHSQACDPSFGRLLLSYGNMAGLS